MVGAIKNLQQLKQIAKTHNPGGQRDIEKFSFYSTEGTHLILSIRRPCLQADNRYIYIYITIGGRRYMCEN